MRLSPTNFLPLVLVALLTGCPCDPSSPYGQQARGVSLQADLVDSTGALMAHIYADLSETRGAPGSRSLSVSVGDPVFGTPSRLAGHVGHLRLLDRGLQVVQEIETSPGNSTTQSILTTTVFFGEPETARYDAMRALFLSGATVVEIETDLPGFERIRKALPVYRSSDWTRPSCD